MKKVFVMKKQKAATLPELMIVMLVISTVMVVAVSVLTNSILRLRANQIEDSVNFSLVRVLESLKTPEGVQFTNSNEQPEELQPYYYSISYDIVQGEEVRAIELNLEDAGSEMDRLNACNEVSVYRTDLSFLDGGDNLLICLQAEIERVGINEDEYDLIARAAYFDRGELITKELRGKRNFGFENTNVIAQVIEPVSTCGNGILEIGEECDGGTCNPNCTLPVCGNNIVEIGEECDGITNCTSNCLLDRCNQEFAWQSGEKGDRTVTEWSIIIPSCASSIVLSSNGGLPPFFPNRILDDFLVMYPSLAGFQSSNCIRFAADHGNKNGSFPSWPPCGGERGFSTITVAELDSKSYPRDANGDIPVTFRHFASDIGRVSLRINFVR